jgi:uncharacterized protein YecT (DUF1311 family)
MMNTSEAFSQENHVGDKRSEDIQRTARITGDPIDVVKGHYDTCDSGNVPEMADCVDYLWRSENKKLNSLFAQARHLVQNKFGHGSVAERQLVREQRAWVNSRDVTCRRETEGYSHGAPSWVENQACLSDLIKKRNDELEEYLERMQ